MTEGNYLSGEARSPAVLRLHVEEVPEPSGGPLAACATSTPFPLRNAGVVYELDVMARKGFFTHLLSALDFDETHEWYRLRNSRSSRLQATALPGMTGPSQPARNTLA